LSRSGSYSFALDRDSIIKDALLDINVINDNQAVPGRIYDHAVRKFQSMIKSFQAEGIQLWNRKQATLFTAYQDAQYSISHTGDHCANSYVYTTLSAAEASGQTILSVTSSTGMTAADYVGIELSSGTRQWTTIVSVDSSTQITVTAALTSAAASGATVVAYTTKIADRPLRILDARIVDIGTTQNTAISMENIGFDEYFGIPVKSTDGRPLNYYYDKMLDAGVAYLFPRPNDVNFVMEFTYHEAIEDVNSSTDSLDFPTEWTEALTLGLAARLCVKYGKFEELKIIKPLADEAKKIVMEFDNDEEPMFILPEGDR
jgi:hypothetical protein